MIGKSKIFFFFNEILFFVEIKYMNMNDKKNFL